MHHKIFRVVNMVGIRIFNPDPERLSCVTMNFVVPSVIIKHIIISVKFVNFEIAPHHKIIFVATLKWGQFWSHFSCAVVQPIIGIIVFVSTMFQALT